MGHNGTWHCSRGRPESVAHEILSWRRTEVKLPPPKVAENLQLAVSFFHGFFRSVFLKINRVALYTKREQKKLKVDHSSFESYEFQRSRGRYFFRYLFKFRPAFFNVILKLRIGLLLLSQKNSIEKIPFWYCTEHFETMFIIFVKFPS